MGGLRKNNKGLIISAVSFLILCILLGVNLVGSYLLDIPIGANPRKEIHDALSSFGVKDFRDRVECFWSY